MTPGSRGAVQSWLEGLHPIPDEGPAVLVCNRVSFVDALVIATGCPRPIRFVTDHNIFKLPVLNFVFRTAKTIPIASAKEDPQGDRAYDEVAKALADAYLLGIFPAGKITRTGDINECKSGIKRSVDRTPVPVAPLALHGHWKRSRQDPHPACLCLPCHAATQHPCGFPPCRESR